MKIAIAISDEKTNENLVADHFGHCIGFQLISITDDIISWDSLLPNPLQGQHGGGGCQLPHFLNDLGVNVVIAGGMGRKALALFDVYRIEVFSAAGMETTAALNSFINGELTGITECAHHGNGHSCH